MKTTLNVRATFEKFELATVLAASCLMTKRMKEEELTPEMIAFRYVVNRKAKKGYGKIKQAYLHTRFSVMVEDDHFKVIYESNN